MGAWSDSLAPVVAKLFFVAGIILLGWGVYELVPVPVQLWIQAKITWVVSQLGITF